MSSPVTIFARLRRRALASAGPRHSRLRLARPYLRNLLMGALQRLREMLWPRPERPAPAWAYAPAPGKRKTALPRPATGPLAEPEWRPMWPGNRPRRPPEPPDDASDA